MLGQLGWFSIDQALSSGSVGIRFGYKIHRLLEVGGQMDAVEFREDELVFEDDSEPEGEITLRGVTLNDIPLLGYLQVGAPGPRMIRPYGAIAIGVHMTLVSTRDTSTQIFFSPGFQAWVGLSWDISFGDENVAVIAMQVYGSTATVSNNDRSVSLDGWGLRLGFGARF